MADLYHLEDEIVDTGVVEDQEEDQENDWENEEAEEVPLVVDKDDLVADLEPEPALELNEPQEVAENTVYHTLYQLWSQEKHSPELLPYEDDTIQELRTVLEEQTVSTGDANLDALLDSIQTIDRQRLKYLLADLLKTRLSKIERYYQFMEKQQGKMSESEVAFWTDYSALVQSHLETTVTSRFSNDDFKAIDAVQEPDLEQFVTLKTIEAIEVDDRAFDADSVLIARYRKVRDFFLSGQVELL